MVQSRSRPDVVIWYVKGASAIADSLAMSLRELRVVAYGNHPFHRGTPLWIGGPRWRWHHSSPCRAGASKKKKHESSSLETHHCLTWTCGFGQLITSYGITGKDSHVSCEGRTVLVMPCMPCRASHDQRHSDQFPWPDSRACVSIPKPTRLPEAGKRRAGKALFLDMEKILPMTLSLLRGPVVHDI